MQQAGHRYFVIHKPYGMESQFKVNYPAVLLGDLPFAFPEGTHAIGRLDKYSEGLLLLTTNKKITSLLFQSKVPHKRTYLVQVSHKVSEETLLQLRKGVAIKIKGGEMYTTPFCDVQFAGAPVYPSPRHISTYVDTSWLQITLTEGKFHQVRKMVKAVRHRCLRLIRISIEDLQLNGLPPGQVKELDEASFFRLLKLQE
jgi:23S rRNA pseudouridine2457 synthase